MTKHGTGGLVRIFLTKRHLKITEAQNHAGGKGWYETDSDRFVFDIQDEEEVIAPIDVEGLKLYWIGNAS